MTSIKKITNRTILFITAVVGVSFFSSLLGKFFFGNSEVNLTKLDSVTSESSGTIISVAQADTPGCSGGGDDGDSSGGCGGSGGGSADGSAGF